ncbi:MAG: hypothetical protein HC913_15005 [Microscillaceae bacterium]|nr:hypothetical protein [Microscillaceae bacterium]
MLASAAASAQCVKIDSLERSLSQFSRQDTQRVRILNELAKSYLAEKRNNTGLAYAQQAQYLAQILEDTLGLADAKMNLGRAYFDDPFTRDRETIPRYEEALALYLKVENPGRLAQAYKTIGNYYYDLYYISGDNYQKALNYFLKYLKISEKTGQKAQAAEACLSIANLYDQLGDEKNSTQYFLKAVQLRETLDAKELDDLQIFAKTKRIFDLQIQSQRFYNTALILGLTLMGIIVTLLLINISIRRRANSVLQKRSLEIEKQKKQIEKNYQELGEKSQEIETQKDLLTMQNEQLIDTQQELQKVVKALEAAKQDLEARVAERTLDLKRANDALTQANEELDIIIYRASHDFKGPVATINGLAHIGRLECKAENEQVQTYFDKIENTAAKMDGMLQKLHQVSYIMGQTYQPAIIRFEDLLDKVQENLHVLITQTEAQIQTEIEPGTRFFGDADMLTYAVENLIENALIFTKEGLQPQISIRVANNLNEALIEIEDFGQGIDRHFLPEIFDMFSRGSESSKGNGLGLYVVHKALEKMQGIAEAESEIGKYTKIRLRIPI